MIVIDRYLINIFKSFKVHLLGGTIPFTAQQPSSVRCIRVFYQRLRRRLQCLKEEVGKYEEVNSGIVPEVSNAQEEEEGDDFLGAGLFSNL